MKLSYQKQVRIVKLHEKQDYFHELDICDMHELKDETYDLTVSFFGPLSYNNEGFETKEAVEELYRVTKKDDGVIIVGPLDECALQWFEDAIKDLDIIDVSAQDIFIEDMGIFYGNHTFVTLYI